MWHTPQGDRTLSGAEANLVLSQARELLSRLHEEAMAGSAQPQWLAGVEMFDNQSLHQRLALLRQVCYYLFGPTESTLELSAELEATVMAIYESIKQRIQLEISMGCDFSSIRPDEGSHNAGEFDEFDALEPEESSLFDASESVRLRVLDVCHSLDPSDDDLPDPWCDDVEQWDLLVESLADCVLWDRDFEMASMIVDEDPTTAATYKQLLGIDPDYFATAPPDIEEDQTLDVIDQLFRFLDAVDLPPDTPF